jgi:UDP-N-acetylglucosamine--N-acetylmuramyl-(pentapeptide) pyrophosphoryl-undecaprenol N-acetylglucosamine transferase
LRTKQKVIFFTGSSGGHINPAVALQKKIPGSHIVAIKSKASVEILKDNPHSILIHPLGIRKLKPAAFIDLLKILIFILKFKPKKVLCCGGYLNLIAILSTLLLKKEIYFYEPNFVPGKGTFLLKYFPKKIFHGFPQTKNFFPEKAEICKIPVRIARKDRTEVLYRLNFDFNRPTLLVMGGSQGAKFINDLVCESIEKLNSFQIIHITGKDAFEKVAKKYSSHRNRHIVLPFSNSMSSLYLASTAVISRAGAGTLAEIAFFKIPAILIPYPGAGGHQKLNALFFAREKAAIVLEQEKTNSATLFNAIEDLVFKKFWIIKENLAKIDISDDGSDLINKMGC